MPDQVIPAIERLFQDLGVEIVEERVLHFIIQEIHTGKTLAEALREPYVENNTTPAWRRQVLERPVLVKAVEEEIERSFKSRGG